VTPTGAIVVFGTVVFGATVVLVTTGRVDVVVEVEVVVV
jgi:hypothetical protein